MVGVERADPRRDLCTPVATLRAVFAGSRAAHQLDERARDPRTDPSPACGSAPRSRSPGVRARRRGKRRRFAAVRLGVRQPRDHLEELDDRTGPTVREEQRQRVRVRRAGVDEVDRLAVDAGAEVLELVEPRLLRAPVVLRRASTRRARAGSRSVSRTPSPCPRSDREDARRARRLRRSSSTGVVDGDAERIDRLAHRSNGSVRSAGGSSRATSITTLPIALPSATYRSAAATSSSANVAPMWGTTRPRRRAGRAARARCGRTRRARAWRSRGTGSRAIVHALQQHEVERDARDRARRVADGHEAAAAAQRPQRRLGEVAADRIDHRRRRRRAAARAAPARRSTGAVVDRGCARRTTRRRRASPATTRPRSPTRRAARRAAPRRGRRRRRRRARPAPRPAAPARPSAARGTRCGARRRTRRRAVVDAVRDARSATSRPTTASSANAPTSAVPMTRSPTATPVDAVGRPRRPTPANSLPGHERRRHLDLVLVRRRAARRGS